MRIKKKSTRCYCLIQQQILRTNIVSNVWQTARRIDIEIVGVKGSILGKSATEISCELNVDPDEFLTK